MKKIFMFLAAACTFVACDPISEDISNGGHISAEELQAMSTVSVDKAASGQNGNVITCSTKAPVNAKWSIGGKDMLGNYAKKKMKLGEHTITLTGLCADGTELTVDFPINCQEITDPLTKYYIYQGEPLTLTGDAATGRFSDNEGKGLPYLSDAVYEGKKTLVFEIVDTQDGPFIWGGDDAPVEAPTMRVMNGWWSATYADDVPVRDQIKDGLWELQLTDDIAKDCASSGDGKDLDLLMTRGSITIGSVYYEE